MNYRFSYFVSILLTLSIILSSCGYERIAQTPDSGRDFEQFCLDVFREEMITADTIDLHYTLNRPDVYGITPQDISLGTCSLEDMVKDTRKRKELRDRLLTFDRSILSKDHQVIYDALLETLNAALGSEGMELYLQPLAPTIGIQAQLPILLAEYAFDSPEDVETYLELLNRMEHIIRKS